MLYHSCRKRETQAKTKESFQFKSLLLRQRKAHRKVCFFRWRIRKDLNASARESDERDRRRGRMKGV